MWNISGKTVTEEKCPTKTCPPAILCTANPKAGALGSNPRYRRQQPTNNRLRQQWQTLNT
jgi:hypothetical protein